MKAFEKKAIALAIETIQEQLDDLRELIEPEEVSLPEPVDLTDEQLRDELYYGVGGPTAEYRRARKAAIKSEYRRRADARGGPDLGGLTTGG